jgi:cbb3-type cytochrome oxidase maturation protein
MDVLVFLIPIALALGFIGLGAFMWTLKAGQYEDLDGAKWRVLTDEDLPRQPDKKP